MLSNPSVIMKKPSILLAFIALTLLSNAQIGIGTTTPFSTLEVNGSLATGIRTFTAATTATIADCNLIFTGTSATTVTLPTAVGITGRMYTLKNASSNTSVLTVATTSSQTIDGATSQILSSQYQTVSVISNGTNWNIVGYALPSGSSTNWSQGGNAVSGVTSLGTTTAFALPFITGTGGIERMRISATGNVAIGTSAFDATNPEKFIVDAGVTSSFNVITGKGTKDGYLQLNIQNKSNGNQASADIVASADNATELINYINMGINSSSYIPAASNILNGVNTAYLFSTGNDFFIGNHSIGKNVILYAGGDNQVNEKLRLTSGTGIRASDDFLPSSTSTYDLGSSSLRWEFIYSNNSLNISDARLKTNIRNLNYGLSTIMKIRSVQYNWKEGVDKATKIGFLAQDLKKIIPEVVVGDETKENLAVNYIELIPVLVNAIKEQQKQIDDLKKMVEELKK